MTEGENMRNQEENREFLKRLAAAEGDTSSSEERSARYAKACTDLMAEDRQAPTTPLKFNSIPEAAHLDLSMIKD